MTISTNQVFATNTWLHRSMSKLVIIWIFFYNNLDSNILTNITVEEFYYLDDIIILMI